MQSSKYRYRVATAPDTHFQVQRSPFAMEDWTRASLDYDTVEQARRCVQLLVAQDDFAPEEVAL